MTISLFDLNKRLGKKLINDFANADLHFSPLKLARGPEEIAQLLQNIATNYEMDKKYKERICGILDTFVSVLFYVWICNNQIK